MTKIFGQDAEIIDDIADVQEEVDNLDGNAMRGTDGALLAASYATERGTDGAALASVWTSDLATALANYTAIRAGYLDQLDFALQEAIAAIPTTAMRGTDNALLAANYAVERGTDNALLAANYITERGTDDALLAANYVTERGTDGAALAASWTAILATALSNYTAIRAGFIDELDAANIPADIGENDDNHDGASLFGRLRELIEHEHTQQKVYPTLADDVTLTTGAGDWALGTIAEIIPANTITAEFDIHEVLIEDVNTQDKTYELVLYYGSGDTECARVRFAATSNKGGVPAQFTMTPLIPANSKIRGQLAIEGGGSKIAKVSLRYHEYD